MYLLKFIDLIKGQCAIFFLAALILISGCKEKIEPLYSKRSIQLRPERAQQLAQQVKDEVSVQVAEGLELVLWAADTLVADPIALSVDDQGRVFYTSATRQEHSEFDIRGHRNWMTASISFQTVEDRRAFLKEVFSETNEEGQKFLKDLNGDGILDWKDLAVEKEQVWFVEDASGDGFADRAQLYLEDFHQEITDVANGIEAYNGEVFISVGPDMWRTGDRDHDGIADQVTSISHGFAVHIGFSGHGMSGAKVGPDGRIWWGIGDIGMNVVDKEGKRWKYPNQGVIVRSELDGSGFEVYSAGVRNTHEFAFDQYGNLISVDNDGDHQGERERLVYLINGSDSGWRINWQFGKYTDPDNNGYKVWMEERLHIPRWEGQAAYILPPIQNYVNGPTGLVFNPGTALDERWYNHFFVAEFRGSPANSPLHAFTLKPKGASFELDQTQEVVRGLLPTGMDFGPDGALYFGDWIDGWGTKDYGRIWKLDVAAGAGSSIRQETRELIQSDFKKTSVEELQNLLHHQDMRVRQKAQFELTTRSNKGFNALKAAAEQKEYQLARVHGIWGIGQMARQQKISYGQALVSLLQDNDAEINAQAAKILGDINFTEAGNQLVPLLKHASLRVQLHACEALGRIQFKEAVQPILDMLEKNNDDDSWLRHAGMIALGRIGDEDALSSLKDHASPALRIAAVVALRRMGSPKVAEFLGDAEEYIVTEAARAINDDYSIEEALPSLAKVLRNSNFQNEALLRRAINANLRLGKAENMDILVAYIGNTQASPAMRAEAIAALGGWAKPSVFDRVDGRYRGVIEREDAPVREIFAEILDPLLTSTQPLVQNAAAQVAGKLQIQGAEQDLLALLKSNPDAQVRQTSLESLFKLRSPLLNEALVVAFADQDQGVRSAALTIVPQSEIAPQQAVKLFDRIMKKGTATEKQAALAALGSMTNPEAVSAMGNYLNNLMAGTAVPAVRLDIIEAVKSQGDKALLEKLQAYENGKNPNDPLSPYLETLEGGDSRRGWGIFYENEAAQCVRCHTIFEMGGTAGPGLAGVGDRLTPLELLAAVVAPSAAYAAGYEVVTLGLDNNETLTGVVLEESADSLKIKVGDQGVRQLAKSAIKERKSVPSSMPPMGQILSKHEIRDVVALLKELKAQ